MLAAHGIEPSTEEEQNAMSLVFNQRLEWMFLGMWRPAPGWLSSTLDEDGSGHVQFDELVDMRVMNISADELPHGRIQALWCALDTDNNNRSPRANSEG